jgi:twitching motility protein PilJ
MAIATKGSVGTVFGGAKKNWKIPLIGHLPETKQTKIVGGLVLLAVVATVVAGGAYVGSARVSAAQTKAATDLVTDSQRIAKNAALTVRGDANAFLVLKQSERRFDGTLSKLRSGGDLGGVSVPAASSKISEPIASVGRTWTQTSAFITRLTASQTTFQEFGKALSELNNLDAAFLGSSRELVAAMESSATMSPKHLAVARQLPFLTQRMGKSSNALAASQDFNLAATFLLGKDLLAYRSAWTTLANGSAEMGMEAVTDAEVRKKLLENNVIFARYAQQVSLIQRNQADTIAAKIAFVNTANLSETLAAASEELLRAYEEESDKNMLILFAGVVFFAFFLGSLGLLVKIFADQGNASARAAEAEKENQVQQQAIMTLLDEIGEVADGNLTLRATVNDTFTGAIADALNYTVGELRRVIQNVVEASNRVGSGAESSTQISTQLAQSARDQSDRLSKTGESIVRMSMNMDDIAEETAEAAKASRMSLEVSQEGLQIIETTIERMNAIRDTIQETSKKIKLLGESSTAIGEVTGLIRDITKQINILALNAAIQAASAGEAGRGFAVVANEVQRLALSSAEAAKRIDDLVLTIQEDAKGAVVAMEDSTREVVEGAKLTDQAGDALKQIEHSVSGLTKAIEDVTSKVETESENASNLSLDMRLLQEFTEKTVDETRRGSESVQQVKSVADELRESVANFTV